MRGFREGREREVKKESSVTRTPIFKVHSFPKTRRFANLRPVVSGDLRLVRHVVVKVLGFILQGGAGFERIEYVF